MITENGWSDEGETEDYDRIEYIRAHMAEVLKVLKNKESNLSGYLGKLKQIFFCVTSKFSLNFFHFQFGLSWTTSNGQVPSRK